MPRAERKYTLDTNVFIHAFRALEANQHLQRFHRAFAPFEHLSAVVAHELLAGAQDVEARRLLDRHLIDPFAKRSRLYSPSADAWQRAGDTLARFRRDEGVDLRRMRRGFANDVLLACSCREAGITLVTNNVRDFTRIAKYLKFDFEPPWPDAV